VCARAWERGGHACVNYYADIAVIVRELAEVKYTVAYITTNPSN
jgi:hypothetical protein